MLLFIIHFTTDLLNVLLSHFENGHDISVYLMLIKQGWNVLAVVSFGENMRMS